MPLLLALLLIPLGVIVLIERVLQELNAFLWGHSSRGHQNSRR